MRGWDTDRMLCFIDWLKFGQVQFYKLENIPALNQACEARHSEHFQPHLGQQRSQIRILCNVKRIVSVVKENVFNTYAPYVLWISFCFLLI